MRYPTYCKWTALICVALVVSPPVSAGVYEKLHDDDDESSSSSKKNNRPNKAEGQIGYYCNRMVEIAVSHWKPIDYDKEEVQGCWGAPDYEPPTHDDGVGYPPYDGDGYLFCMSQAMKQMKFEPFDRANQMCNKAYSRDQLRYERRLCNAATITRVLCPWEFNTTCAVNLETPPPATPAPTEPPPDPETSEMPVSRFSWFRGKR